MSTSRYKLTTSGFKRKVSDNDIVISDEISNKRVTTLNGGLRANPTSFSSSSQYTSRTSEDALKRSVSWSGSSSSPNTILSPITPFSPFEELSSYEENILSHKFVQQNMLLLKQSVFRSNTMGVTKNTHNRACDLICGAGHAYGTGKGTIILGMHLFDRALSLTAVRKNEAVLLAATCLLTAAKLEEINPPYAEELAYYCGKSFEKEDIYSMEQVLLPLFQCQISLPTRHDFSERFCEIAHLSDREKSLVLYLIEMSFLDYNLHYFLPSKVAAGAVHLAMQMLRHGSRLSASIWSPRLERSTRCPERDLVEIVLRLRRIHWHIDTSAMQNILTRYPPAEHYGLADIAPLPYSQIRFDNKQLLPNNKIEFELPEYAESKNIEKK